MLKKKQSIKSNSEWLACYASATQVVSERRSRELAEAAVNRINEVASGLSCCSGWIAGKDSIVLQHILERSDAKFTPIIWRGVNEYPEMRLWIEEHKPSNLKESVVGKFTLDYLEEHPEYLFCQGDGTRQKWMAAKWAKQKKDVAGYDLFITGRRLADGNVCGRKEDSFVRGKAFSPIADWSHEELFAYMAYNGIELPPFYRWKRGFLIGSVAMGEWTERPALGMTNDEVWDEIAEIDPSIIVAAAEKLTSARNYLKEKRL